MRSDPAGDAPRTEVLALCRQVKPLERSHIVPKSVFRWLLETSAGQLRMSDTPSRRVQDGPTLQLLCRDCEARFSAWERQFANEVFLPFHKDGPTSRRRYRYGHWAPKFAASLSWRNLQHLRRKAPEELNLPASILAKLGEAEETWRRFLLGELPHPGEFEQHVYPCRGIARIDPVPPWLSPQLNFYILRSVDLQYITDDEDFFATYTELPGFFVLGFSQWKTQRA